MRGTTYGNLCAISPARSAAPAPRHEMKPASHACGRRFNAPKKNCIGPVMKFAPSVFIRQVSRHAANAFRLTHKRTGDLTAARRVGIKRNNEMYLWPNRSSVVILRSDSCKTGFMNMRTALAVCCCKAVELLRAKRWRQNFPSGRASKIQLRRKYFQAAQPDVRGPATSSELMCWAGAKDKCMVQQWPDVLATPVSSATLRFPASMSRSSI